MNPHRDIGLDRLDGFEVGRDPRSMSSNELEQLGHARMSPLRALRLKCLDCCNGSAQEVRLCTALDCTSWPFRMGKNPWAAPVSGARREQGRRLGMKRVAERSGPFADNNQIEASAFDGGRVPNDTGVDFSPIEMGVAEGGLA
jgi:hypothetical protein